ncbi:MAG TPA: FG-GAP-like repeat-containing protein [Thermoanaerobaculia bacterium]|nr:FG-GAP-like repeat-containing protein [Thermoanaerobaculia bacterium]
MRRSGAGLRLAVFTAALAVVLVLLAARQSRAAGDVPINSPTPFSTLDGSALDADGVANGVFTVNGALTIGNGGSVTCNDDPPLAGNAGACAMRFQVSGNFALAAGASLSAENRRSGGSGGAIAIDAGGDFVMEGPGGGAAGALISAKKTTGAGDTGQGGDVVIHAAGDVTVAPGARILADSPGEAGSIEITGRIVRIGGLVSSNGSTTVGRGGPITIVASCDLTILDTGVVSSRGQDPGADLVRLAGCRVSIDGLVESTGPGHQNAAGKNLCNAPSRPGHPANSTACVEIWSGTTIEIDSNAPHAGEVNADTALSGGTQGRGWIDLFANGDISVIGDAAGAFAVHANQPNLTNGTGGQVVAKSLSGNIAATGLAFQADATPGGGDGGSIDLDAFGAVLLNTSSLFARGDFAPAGGLGKGGRISARAETASVSWTSGAGDVRPTGTGVTENADPTKDPRRGVVDLTACGSFVPGASFPFLGSAATTPTPNIGAAYCGAPPVLPQYAQLPPPGCLAACGATPTPTPTQTPTGVASTPTPTRTAIPVTATPTPTATSTAVAETPTPTPTPTATPTAVVETPTPTPTPTPTAVVETPTPTPTNTPSNQPPQLPALSDRTVSLGDALALRLFADDPNPSDLLNFSLPIAPAGAELDPTGSPLFRFAPSAEQVGRHTVTVRVQDGGGLADEKSFSITVVAANRPPSLDPQPDQRIPAAGPFLRTLTGSDPDAGDPLTFSLLSGPAGMSLSGNVLQWTPASTQLGETFVTIAVADGAGASDSKRFALTVFTAAKPVVRDDSYSVTVGQTLDVAAAGVLANDVDPEGGALAAQKLTDPDKGFLSSFGTDGAFRFLAPPAPIPPAFAVEQKWWVQDGFGYAPPLVVDLNGDNFPDVVNFHYNNIARALDGRNGAVLWSINGIAGCGFYLGAGTGHFAVGDLDEDGTPEIVALGNCNDTPGSSGPLRIVAINHDGTLHWKGPAITTQSPPNHVTLNKISLTLARLSAGAPVKVLALKWVDDTFGSDGSRGCRIFTGDPADEGVACSATLVLSGADGSLERVLKGPEPIPNAYVTSAFEYLNFPPVAVADLDGDGVVEIVSGHIVHENGGAVRWSAPRASVDTAVADLDGDGYAELIMLLKESTNFVRTLAVYDRSGAARWTFPFSTLGARLVVADVDADGAPDILATSNRDVWVFRSDGRILWTHKTAEAPQGDGFEATGHNRPAVFDLDGDGFPEVIVQHTSGVYFLDGRDGHQKAYVDSQSDEYDYTPYGNMPVVADVDADGHADVTLALRCGPCGRMGIRVLTSANDGWQPAPGVWNQLNYRPSTVDGRGAIAFDGTVPKDFRVQAPLATPVDPRERMRTAFTYAATNSALTSDPATVTIDILPDNRPPLITSTPPTRFLASVASTYQLTSTDPDPGDTATWSIEISDIGQTDQFSIDPVTGLFSYRLGNRLDYLFVVRVTDSQGGFHSQPIILSRATTTRTVPNVVGQTQAVAAATLSGAGLTAGAVVEVYSPTAAGVVVAQAPAAGIVLPQGERVALTVSKGPEPVVVPSVVGRALTIAGTILDSRGFSAGTTSYVYNAAARGDVVAQVPAAGTLAVPGPVALTVSGGTGLAAKLNHEAVTAGNPIMLTVEAFAADGTLQPLPATTKSLAPSGDFSGTMPTLSGATITVPTSTRGTFEVTVTEVGGAGRVAKASFAVLNQDNPPDAPTQHVYFAQVADALTAASDLVAQLDVARGANDATQMRTLLAQIVNLWKTTVNMDKLSRSAPLAPSGGFLPALTDLPTAGLPQTSDDALLVPALDGLDAALAAMGDVLGEDPGSLAAFNSQQAALDSLAIDFGRLEPSPYGVLDGRAAYASILARRLPQVIDLWLKSVETRLASSQSGAGIGTMFALPITLAEVSQATSIQVLLVKKLYMGAIKHVAYSAAALILRNLLRSYFNTGALSGIVTAASLSFHIFETDYSTIEVLGTDWKHPQNTQVLIIGPTAIDLISGLKDKILDLKKKVNNTSADIDKAKNSDEIKSVFEGIRDSLSSAIDAGFELAAAFDSRNFMADLAYRGCLLDNSPACNTLVYKRGFQPVHVCHENELCLPAPVFVIVWSTVDGGVGIDTFNFFPKFVPRSP